MKNHRAYVITLGLLVLFIGGVVCGGTFTVLPWTGDDDSGISAEKTYTHTAKFAGPEGVGVVAANGVLFEGDNNHQGTNWTLTGAPNPFGTNNPVNVSGLGANLVRGFFYGDLDASHPVLTLTDLTPGQDYVITFYTVGFGGAGGRFVTITPSDDPNEGQTEIDENGAGSGNGQLIKYAYTAPESGEISFTFDARNTGDSWHHYAFSNEVAQPFELTRSPNYGDFVNLNVDLSWSINPADAVTNPTYNLYYGSDPNNLQEVAGLTEPTYSLSNLPESTDFYWKIEIIEDGGDIVYTSKLWPFTTITTAPAEKALEWKMDETSGTVATETVGGYNGTLIDFADPNAGGTTWVNGLVNNCLNFDAPTSYVDLGSDAPLPFGAEEAFSISCYVNTADMEGPIIAFRNSADDDPILALVVGFDGADSQPGKLRFISRSGGILYRLTGPVMTDSDWNHVALTRAGDGTVTLYLNGVAVGSLNDGRSAYDVDWRAIGGEIRWINDEHGSVGQRFLEGKVDEVAIWNGVLKQDQIDAMVAQIPYRLDPTPAINSDVNPDVVLGWFAPLGTIADTHFTVTVATDPGMTSVVYQATDLTENSFDPDPDLDYDTAYYWQVQQLDASDTVVFTSPVWNFQTVASTVGVFSTAPWTNDGDSGIQNNKTYTHAVAFNSPEGEPIPAGNGVFFEGDGDRQGDNWSLTGTAGVFNNFGVAVSGEGANLVRNFFYGDNDTVHPVLTLTGLTPGTKYITTFYCVGFGGPGGRFVDITVSDNPENPYRIDENMMGSGQGLLVKYTYTATTDTISFTFDALSTGDSWHQYAFSNEVALPFDLSPTPASNQTVPADVQLSWEVIPAGDADGDTFNLYLGTDPNMDSNLIEVSGLTEASYSPAGLQPNTKYYWKVEAQDGENVVYTSPVWTFYTASTTQATKIAEWKLDETAGTAAPDTFDGFNGTLTGFDNPDSAWTAGLAGNSLMLNGAGEYVDLGDTSELSAPAGQAFSISAYIKTTDSEGPIITFRNPGILCLYVGFDGADSQPGKLRFISWSAGVLYRITGPTVNDGKWHNVAVTRSSFGSVQLYVDGALVGTTFDGGVEYTNQWGALGTDRTWLDSSFGSEPQRYLDGQIDEVTIWLDTLQPNQLSDLAALVPPAITGDIDGDGDVDVDDVKLFTSYWLSTQPIADFNGDGIVNLADFSQMAENWLVN